MAVTPWIQKSPTLGPKVNPRPAWKPVAKKPVKAAVAKKVVVPKKKPVGPNFRPDGWAMEGVQVTDKNRAKFPSSMFEVVSGRKGTLWARPRTETTGIDPSYLGQIQSFDDTTKRADSQIKTVYGALGTTLQGNAADATRRLGALVNLAGQDAGSFDAGAAAVPGGGSVSGSVNPGVAAIDQAQIDTGQTQAMRGAAMAVNTANLDAQQSQGFGAQMRAQLASDRGNARTEYLRALLFRSQDMAAAAREAQLQFLGDQASAQTKAQIEQAKLDQQAAIANMNEQGRNNRAALDASTKTGGADAQAKLVQAWTKNAHDWTPGGSDGLGVIGGTLIQLKNADGTPALNPDGTPKVALTNTQSAKAYFSKGVVAGVDPVKMLQILLAAGAQWNGTQAWQLLKPILGDQKAADVARRVVGPISGDV